MVNHPTDTCRLNNWSKYIEPRCQWYEPQLSLNYSERSLNDLLGLGQRLWKKSRANRSKFVNLMSLWKFLCNCIHTVYPWKMQQFSLANLIAYSLLSRAKPGAESWCHCPSLRKADRKPSKPFFHRITKGCLVPRSTREWLLKVWCKMLRLLFVKTIRLSMQTWRNGPKLFEMQWDQRKFMTLVPRCGFPINHQHLASMVSIKWRISVSDHSSLWPSRKNTEKINKNNLLYISRLFIAWCIRICGALVILCYFNHQQLRPVSSWGKTSLLVRSGIAHARLRKLIQSAMTPKKVETGHQWEIMEWNIYGLWI